MPRATLLPIALLLACGAAAIRPAHAETYSTCAGFIEALPATITTQGTWCLRKDLTTAITSGNAITIAANNVTIDCNNFKIGGLGAGNGSWANGIAALSPLNATIRNCSVRGFHHGVQVIGGAGHLIEDNLLDQNLSRGIEVWRGDGNSNSQILRNRINNTGGNPVGGNSSMAILADADIIDNTISGVFSTTGTGLVMGIGVMGGGNSVTGNVIRGLQTFLGDSSGIHDYSEDGSRISDNHLYLAIPVSASTGISANRAFCTGNSVHNFESAYSGCAHSSRNLRSTER